MTVPKVRPDNLIDDLIYRHSTPHGESLASIHPCAGTKFHSPTPLLTECSELYPGRQVWLCPTCKSKLEVFIHLYEADQACLTWEVMRQFGNQVRMLGQEVMSFREMDALAERMRQGEGEIE